MRGQWLMHEMIGNGWRNNWKDFSEFLIGNLFRIRKSTTNASLQKWRHIHSNTYSERSWTESCLNFSVGLTNSFKAGLRISAKVTWSKVAGFLIFSKAVFLVSLFSSDRHLTSLWRLYKRKRLVMTSLLTNEQMIVTAEKLRPQWQMAIGNSNSDLHNAGAVLYQLSYQANWELIVMWVDYKPLDNEQFISISIYIYVMYLNSGLRRSLKCEILEVF